MELRISSEKTLAQIASDFHHIFPGLKLEFFSRAHDDRKLTSPEHRLPLHMTVAQAGKCEHENHFDIHPEMTVSELETHFYEMFAIGAQVLRHSASLWLQTGATDGWTLAKQNREGSFDALPVEDDLELVSDD
ncbi:MAG: hypothetical protein EAZ89_19825 [Bacteroidetes bacterium]|jgi:hypothetical protein|nr:MAG: hypothetical protein EAZ89_19825 [Bacteroidota bacterium]